MITSGQKQVTATSGTILSMPPGPATVLLCNNGTASTVWVGIGGTGVSATNGFPVISGVAPVAIAVYAGSQGGQPLLGASSGGTGSLGWIVSTPVGGTGF